MGMTDEEKVSQVCALTGAGSVADRPVVEAYLLSARSLIMLTRHPFSQDPDSEAWETRYDGLQCEIAASMFNRRGADGEISHKENGVDRTWATAGVPKHLLSRIVPIGKAVRL